MRREFPEVYTNLGYAYLGLNDFDSSQRVFIRSIQLNSELPSAYYGLAISLEGKKDFVNAIPAMRKFIKLNNANDKYTDKANAAIREWETKVNRTFQNEGWTWENYLNAKQLNSE